MDTDIWSGNDRSELRYGLTGSRICHFGGGGSSVVVEHKRNRCGIVALSHPYQQQSRTLYVLQIFISVSEVSQNHTRR